jgi:poly(hydroxyalkanoate) depolymerase family esterase
MLNNQNFQNKYGSLKREKVLPFILILSLWLRVGFCNAQQQTCLEIKFDKNPGNLNGYVFAPPSTKDSIEKRPLVIALHGCSQNQTSFASESGWNKLAAKNDFVVLYPSQKRFNNVSNCFNWFKTEDITKNSGELQSIISMIDQVVATYNIDTSRIYVYGVSAGAAMSVCMLAIYPSYFQSGAILAGAPYGIAENVWQATTAMIETIDKSPKEWGELIQKDTTTQRYPHLIVCHGTKDKIVTIKNSYELIEQWTCLHQIDTIPDDTVVNFHANGVNKLVYKDTNNFEKIIFYEISDLGHAIPIDPGEGIAQGGTSGTFAKDIDFFSTYFIAKDFGLIRKNETISNKKP